MLFLNICNKALMNETFIKQIYERTFLQIRHSSERDHIFHPRYFLPCLKSYFRFFYQFPNILSVLSVSVDEKCQ